MRIALLGAGRVGRVHARNIASHPGTELVAVYDLARAASRRVADEHGAAVAESAEEVWASSEIDAVLIAASTDTHVDLLLGSVRAAKAVFCEKPIDLDVGRARRAVEEAATTGVPVFLGFRRRFLQELRSMRAQFQAGAIGRLEVVQMIARDFRPPPIEYVEVSGGFLRDKTIHYFDLLCWLAGEAPVEVHATGACLVDPAIARAGDVDTVLVTLRLPSGALCQITNGRRCAFGVDERIELSGALGRLEWRHPTAGRVAHLTGQGTVLGCAEPAGAYFREETFAAALDAFVGQVGRGEPMSPSLEDGLRAQAIADAATTSLSSGRPETITY